MEKRKIAIISILTALLTIFSVSRSEAISLIKVICDIDGENIYLDGKFKAKCNSNEPVTIPVKPGKHTISVRKNNHDGSYYYYKKVFRIGNGVQRTIDIASKVYYTEYFFYYRAIKTENILDFLAYLKKFPKGRYAEKIKKIIGNSWEKTFNKGNFNIAYNILQTRDKNLFVLGSAVIKNNDATWILKLDRDGNKIWEKTFVHKNKSFLRSAIQTQDRGYVLTGYTEPDNKNYTVAWILKLDKAGNKLWEKTFSSTPWITLSGREVHYDSEADMAIQTENGDIIVVGHKGQDKWIARLDKNGNLKWEKTSSVGKIPTQVSIIQTHKGNYLLTETLANGYIEKLSNNGTTIWGRKLGNFLLVTPVQTRDGNIIVAGTNDDHGIKIWKIDNNDGKIMWEKSITNVVLSSSAINPLTATDSGFVLAGDIKDNDWSTYRIWLAKLDGEGNLIWRQILSSKEPFGVTSIIKTSDNSLVLAGYREDPYRIWLLKLDKTFLKFLDKTSVNNRKQ